ncbi:MAG TPA: hypothetical protein VLB74_00310, partial [Flavobacterium sp.]|nr:hypothetical protein [Flavobacterium sp.]
MLIIICCTSLLRGQEKIPRDIEKIEKEIESYIFKEIKTYQLKPETVKGIREAMLSESKEHSSTYNEENFKQSVNSAKYYELREEFFKKHPQKKLPYQTSVAKRQLICNNGDFETADPNIDFDFRHFKSVSLFPGGYNPTTMVTTGFGGIGASNTQNFNSFATIVTNSGSNLDPAVNTPRVQFGNRAIKLNGSSNTGPSNTGPPPGFMFSGLDITTMTTSFTVDENFLNYNYSLILQNPSQHTPNEQPFFAVRIYDLNYNIIRQNIVVSNPNDCVFASTQVVTDEVSDLTLFTGWRCDRIDTHDLIGQEVILEFIIADCSRTGHFGTVYIDNICGTNCANPISGSINLNSIPTIVCPTTTQTICGTYELPLNGQYGDISLNIIQNGVVIASIPSPTSLNQTNQTFCFTVPVSLFGANPNGNYEFQVQGNFTRICPNTVFNLNPIFDNSANDTGPDVSFNNCINAVDDMVRFSTCTMSKIPILGNDSVFGNPASTGNVIITQTSPVIPQLTLNTSLGFVSVTPGTAPGVYTLTYSICNLNNPLHCDVATVRVTLTPPVLNAANDDFSASPINGCEGGTTTTVFTNDSFCGSVLNPSLFTVTLIDNGGLTGATISNSGNITVPASVAPGNYMLTYQLCQIGNLSNCGTATVLIKVNPGATPIFTFPTAICGGTVPPVLPTISVNGIQGTWNPAVINNTAPGNYTFTPIGQCAVPVTVPVTLIPGCGIFISWGSDVSCQLTEEDPRIKFDENIADGPCIRVCENSTITYSLTGDTGTIDHTVWNITGGNIVSWNNTSVTITWTSAAFCALQGT